MQDCFKKYFWDGTTGWSETYILRRILEAASFLNLNHYPFDKVKRHFDEIDISKLRTGDKRKVFLRKLTPYISDSNNWEEAINKMTKPA